MAYRRVYEPAVVDVFEGGEQEVEHPSVNPQEDTQRRAHGQVGFGAEQLTRLVFERIQQLCVGGASETGVSQAPVCGFRHYAVTSNVMVSFVTSVAVKATETLLPS